MAAKTNAIRLLEQAGVAHEVRHYDAEPGEGYAVEVARQIGLPPAQVFKTLVVRGDRHGPCLGVIPADAELDLKALARARGDRKIAMVPLDEVRPLTGYVRGGVTALGMKRPLPVYLDESALSFAHIAVSGGIRGAQIVLEPSDYRRVVSAVVAPIARRDG